MIFTFWKCVDLSSNSILFLHGLHWLFSILGYKRDIFHKSNARPDLAKFYQFGNILQVFGQFLKAFISIWQKFMPSFVISNAFGWFSYAINRPILKNNLAIWSQWRLGRPHSTPSAPTPHAVRRFEYLCGSLEDVRHLVLHDSERLVQVFENADNRVILVV